MEAVNYSDSPLAEYLKEAGETEDTIYDADRPSYPSPPASPAPVLPETTTTKLAPPSSPSTSISSPGPYPDLIKYTLASSGLLNPNLQDALLGYPEPSPSAAKPIPIRIPSPDVNPVVWPEGWDSYGSSSIFSKIINRLPNPTSYLFPPQSPEPPMNNPFQSIGLGIGLLLPNSGASAVPTPVQKKALANLLKELEELVKNCQEFDLRVVRGIEEKESVGSGKIVRRVLERVKGEVERSERRGQELVGLSWGPEVANTWTPTPAPTGAASDTTPIVAPSSPSPFSTPRPRPPKPNSKQRPSSLFLPRATSPSRNRPPRPSSMIQTNTETVFGGIDRAALGSPVSATKKRRNGSSLGGDVDFWRNLHSATPSRSSRSGPVTDDEDDGMSEANSQVQETFEELHKTRGRFLWSLVGLMDLPTPKTKSKTSPWDPIVDLLAQLTGSFRSASLELRLMEEKGHKKTGSALIDSELGGLGRKASWRRQSLQSNPVVLPAAGGRSSRPTSMIHPSSPSSNPYPHHHHKSLSQSLPPSYSSTSTRSNSRHRPLSTSFHPNFAPPNPSSTSSPAYQFSKSNENILLTLRTIISKISLVEEDVLSSGKEGKDADRVLLTHESIRGDLDRLGREWEEGRVRLRTVLKQPAELANGNHDEEEQEEVQERANSSLDSIPDVGEDFSPREESNVFSNDEIDHPSHSHQASDASITSSFLDDMHNEEQIFEAVSGQDERRQKSQLSREDRIRMMKAERSHDGGAIEQRGMKVEVGMVEELKDVLSLLKNRKKLPEDE